MRILFLAKTVPSLLNPLLPSLPKTARGSTTRPPLLSRADGKLDVVSKRLESVLHSCGRGAGTVEPRRAVLPFPRPSREDLDPRRACYRGGCNQILSDGSPRTIHF